VWSCGVILFALICGFLPFDEEQINKLFKKIKSKIFMLEGIFTIPDFISPEASDLLKRVIVTDPTKRLTIF
jgi:serine/threonine protein kinase